MSNKVLRKAVKSHHMLVSMDTLVRMDNAELEARAVHFREKAREILNAQVDSKNIELLAEIRATAKAYARESIRSRMVVDARNTHFNGFVPGKSSPTNGRMVAANDEGETNAQPFNWNR